MHLDPNPPARPGTPPADAGRPDRPNRKPPQGTEARRGMPLDAYDQLPDEPGDGKPPMRYVPPGDMGG